MAPRDRHDQHPRPRAREVEDLTARFHPPPRGSCLLIDGDAGIGKTWLLEQAAAAATARGWTHVPLRGERDLQDTPLGALPPGLRPTGATRGDRAAVTLTVDRVESLTVSAPVLLTVDDAQWLDPLTCRLLAALGPRTGTWPLVLAVSHRPWPLPDAVLEVLGDLSRCDPHQTHLAPLTATETHTLAADAAGADGLPPRAEVLLGKTGGNPFYVLEVVRAARSWTATDTLDPPAQLRRAVLRRIEECGPGVADVLRFAAILGSDFRVTDLALLVGATAAQLAGPLEAATRAGVLTDDPSGPDPALHARPGPRGRPRRDARRRARRLAPRRRPRPRPRRRTRRPRRGAVDGRGRCRIRRRRRGDLLAAARRGRVPEPGDSARAPRPRPGLLPAGDRRAPRSVHRERLSALAASGRHAEVLAATEDLLAAGEDPELRGWHGLALLGTGRVADALADLDPLARTAAGLHDPAVIPFTALGASCGCGSATGKRAVAACALLERSELDDATRCALLTTRALAALAGGDVPQAVDLARRAVAVADTGGLPRAVVVDPHMTLGNALVHLDDFVEAERCFRLVARATLEPGVDPPPGYHWGLIGVHYFTGRLEDADAEATAGLERAAETGESWGSSVGVALRARIRLHQGRPEDAGVLPDPEETGAGYADDWLLWARALAAEARSDAEAAAEDGGPRLGPAARAALPLRVARHGRRRRPAHPRPGPGHRAAGVRGRGDRGLPRRSARRVRPGDRRLVPRPARGRPGRADRRGDGPRQGGVAVPRRPRRRGRRLRPPRPRRPRAGRLLAAERADGLGGGRRRPRPPPGRRPAARARRHDPRAGPARQGAHRLGGAHPLRAGRVRPRRRGADEQGDRRAPAHLAAHRREPPPAHLPQARRHQPGPPGLGNRGPAPRPGRRRRRRG